MGRKLGGKYAKENTMKHVFFVLLLQGENSASIEWLKIMFDLKLVFT